MKCVELHWYITLVYVHIPYIMDTSCNIMFSEKGKCINVIDGFKFLFHKSLKNDIERWRYVKKTWKSFYKLENETIIKKNISHNHKPDEANILTR